MAKVQEFNEEIEDFESWEERLRFYFIANQIKEEVQAAYLLSCIGAKSYKVLKNELYPDRTEGKTYQALVYVLKEKYKSVTSIFVKRFNFYNRKQEGNEKIESFIAALKELARDCKFETFLDQALRDRLVCGIVNTDTQKKLFGETEDLTFNRACQIAINDEATEYQRQMICGEIQVNQLNKRQSKRGDQGKPKSQWAPSNKSCFRCGRKHDPTKCPAIDWECFICKKKGHTKYVCKSRRNLANVGEEQEEFLSYLKHLGKVRSETAVMVNACIENFEYEFEVDTGACRTVLHIQDFKELRKLCEINPVQFKLRVVTGDTVKIVGEAKVNVCIKDKWYKELPLVLIDCENKFSPLLGRNWLSAIKPGWQKQLKEHITEEKEINKCEIVVNKNNELLSKELMKAFPTVFDENMELPIKGFTASISLKEDVKPVFHRAYEMPYALKTRVEEELNRLIQAKILVKVEQSNWASPIVVVPKKDNKEVRICVDFKRTLNPNLETSCCSLPIPADIYASLSGSKVFTVIDLKGAYQQLEVDDSSKELLTINTHLGLFRFLRLTYGVKTAPGMFQAFMESVLAGVRNTKCYLDDILISGNSLEDCHNNVIEVLQRLQKYNIKVNRKKCEFFKTKIQFLGHVIQESGISPCEDKLQAIKNTPNPNNVMQVKSYLGLLNYYGQFIPMLSSKLKPLYDLCKKEVPFVWSEECEKSFKESKELLVSDKILVHYDPNLPLIVTCDASSYGVGAVLSHRVNGLDKPIMFASSTLSNAEKGYSQIEREALAIMFAVKKFHKFVFGRQFTLVTDHQPLQYIFGNKSRIPVTSANRLQRWAIILSGYMYTIEYKKGKSIGNADALSRLPTKDTTNVTEALYSFNTVESAPLSHIDVAAASTTDEVISKVLEFTWKGWPTSIKNEKFKPYFAKRQELSVESNCLIWCNKVVIPEGIRRLVLESFHDQHIGVVRTKMLMRSYCWWPGMNEDIETFIARCSRCQETQNNRSDAPLRSWPSAINNFQRVHIDLFHKFGYNFLIWVDSKSKWIEVKFLNKGTSAKEVIIALKEIISVVGLPMELVSDNGPPFSSQEFIKFCQANGIQPSKSPPYHPQSNGLAERGVQTVKKALEKAVPRTVQRLSESEMREKLAHFLFAYRNTPSTATGTCPSENVLKMKPRVKFDLIKPTFNGQSSSNLIRKEKVIPVRNTKLYNNGETVFVKNKNDRSSVKWEKGKIVRIMSFNTYLVLMNGIIKHVHKDMLRSAPEERLGTDIKEQPRIQGKSQRDPTTSEEAEPRTGNEPSVEVLQRELTTRSSENIGSPETATVEQSSDPTQESSPPQPITEEMEEVQNRRSTPTIEIRRSSRISRPPVRFHN